MEWPVTFEKDAESGGDAFTLMSNILPSGLLIKRRVGSFRLWIW